MSGWTAEDATRELLSVLPLLNRIISAELRLEAGEDTTMPQFRVMAYLCEGPLTLSALARKRRVSLQAAGELVQSLVERGWVTRSPDPTDRRQWLLALTEEGRVRYEHAQDRMLRRLVPFLERLTVKEMTAVRIALSALHRVLMGDEDSRADDEH
jgi:DNA-binding MarR family transcriptional regulator